MNRLKLAYNLWKLEGLWNTVSDQIKKGDTAVKWLPSLVTLLVTAAGMFEEPVQNFISHNPKATMIVGGIALIVKHLLPSPIQPRQ